MTGEPPMTADLPPCGGDVRHDRGGREGAPILTIPTFAAKSLWGEVRVGGTSRRNGQTKALVLKPLLGGRMFFYLSKILWFFAQPLNLAILLIFAGLLAAAFGMRRTP